MMLLQKTALTGLLVFLFFSLAVGQENDCIDVETMREHLSYLASDQLQGRRLGTETDGLNMAADYLKNYAAQIGLKAGVPGYFQNFELVSYGPDADNGAEVIGKNSRRQYRTNELVRIDGGHDEQTLHALPVVFAGFGEGKLDADLSGKVVVIAQGNAANFGMKKNTFWNRRAEYSKARSLMGRNPAAVLVVAGLNDRHQHVLRDLQTYFKRPRYSLPDPEPGNRSPIVVVLPELADKLLGGKNKYKKYLADVAAGNSTGIFEIENRKLDLSLKIDKGSGEVKNVATFIEGSDPKLKDECVVFMAHYDHIGVNENGEVFNGADDNGSGTVTLMEVAKAISSMKEKPRRSIVFLWVTCEELGMFGSGYYSENPVFPMEKTVTCINLDMVGRVYEPRDSVWKDSPKLVRDFEGLFTLTNDAWPGLAELCNKRCEQLGIVPDTSLSEHFLQTSDHYNFHKHGVPILNLATGYHADYHQVGDEVEKINFEKMKKVAELCVLLGIDVANRDEIPIEEIQP